LFVAAYQWRPAVVPLFFVPLLALNWASAAYAAAHADEARLRGLHRASALLGAAVDPLVVADEFLEEVRACFEAEAAELVIVDAGGRLVHRVPEGGSPLAVPLTELLLTLPEAARLTAPAGNPEGWRDCLAAPLREGI